MYRSWHHIYSGYWCIWKHPKRRWLSRPLRQRWRPYTWVVRSATGEVLSGGVWEGPIAWVPGVAGMHFTDTMMIHGKLKEFQFNLETEEIVEIRVIWRKVCNASMRVVRFQFFFISCERQIVATVLWEPPSKLSESSTNGTPPSHSPTTLLAIESHAFFSMTPIEYGWPPRKINTTELT